MPPRPSMATMRKRPPTIAPGRKRPWSITLEWWGVRWDEARMGVARGVAGAAAGRAPASTGRLRVIPSSGATEVPHEGQKWAPGGTGDGHFRQADMED